MQKIKEAGKNVDNDGNVLQKLMNNAVYGITMEKLKESNQCKTCKQQKRLFKMDI